MLAAWPASMGVGTTILAILWIAATASGDTITWPLPMPLCTKLTGLFGAKCAHKTTHLNFYDYTLLYTLVYLLTIAR